MRAVYKCLGSFIGWVSIGLLSTSSLGVVMKTGARRKKIRLGVNIDHIATLRQVRGATTSYPDLLKAASLVAESGAEQITIHLREDRRHIQDSDVVALCKQRPCMINLEMAATPEMLSIALRHRPDWVCFVPEKRRELTTEGGLDVVKIKRKLAESITKLKIKGVKVSLFIAPDLGHVEMAAKLGADAIELHTGHWVLLKGKKKEAEWRCLCQAAELAHKLGLRVHAGHGLDLVHCSDIKKMPHLEELNIGHSIVCHSVFGGLQKTVREFRRRLS